LSAREGLLLRTIESDLREKGTAVRPTNQPTPETIVGSLLNEHPEALVLLAEAGHCRALAACSAADAGFTFRAVQAARLGHEELRHRIDPRRRRPVNFGAGAISLLTLAAGLAVLDFVELSGLLDGLAALPPALAASVVWLTVGWLGALAGRKRRWGELTLIAMAAALLGLLLMTLFSFTPHPGLPAIGEHAPGSTVAGILFGVLILTLTAGAGILIASLEPPGLLPARRRWRRAQGVYDEAEATSRADQQADAIATHAWLGLVRVWATAIAPGEEQLIAETAAFAAAMIESGWS
jgi:hypothetical protein